MAFDRNQRITFDEVAMLYDEVRPGYPEQLIEDVLCLSEIPANGRILEIGCGPGKATMPFAKRGYRMLCLELGQNLARLAAENCRLYPQVRIQNISFEDWPVERESFDLVISAQAFHWLSPEIRYAKVAACLKDGGAVALFWNHYPAPDTPLFRALDEVYRSQVPEMAGSARTKSLEDLIRDITEAISSSGYFENVVVKRYPWSERYEAEQYVKLLNTYSDHLSLAAGKRHDLFTKVRELIKQYGGVVEKPYLAVLYWARVSRTESKLMPL